MNLGLVHAFQVGKTPRAIAWSFLAIYMACLPGCTAVRAVPSTGSTGLVTGISAGFFVPVGAFEKQASGVTKASAGLTVPPVHEAAVPTVPPTFLAPEVLLYASPSTRAFFSTGGVDAKVNIRIWEVFLRKYKIPFRTLTAVEQLEKAQPGVLLMPSTVALSERERRGVTGFREKGGSVLASWLSGVRSENGEWLGFGFMEAALDARVVGNTGAAEDDNFMMPHGDGPVTHSLPAGLRVWLERSKELHPLRLVGRNSAAHVMDWSRTVIAGKPSAAIVFDERRQLSGRLSRSVVLGYPEQLWLSADPKALEAIAHNALMWLLRQPVAYVAAWPAPYTSALTMAVDAAEIVQDSDLTFASGLEGAGGRATFYVLSDNVAKSAPTLKQLRARGHEIAYLGDRFDGFKDQSSSVQAKRLDSMRKEIRGAGLDIAADAGFHAPMESYDRVTEKLVKDRGFGHFVSFMDATDARLPFFVDADSASGNAANNPRMVVLPRTQKGPEDAMEEGDPEEGMANFLAELDLAKEMGGLSVVRLPNQNLLTNEQLAEIFGYLKPRKDHVWLATAGQVAQWWHQRDLVSARLDPSGVAPQLTVRIRGESTLRQAVTVWVNLPESGGALRLVPIGSHAKLPKIARVDGWRSALVLEGFAPGAYQWSLYFDRPAANGHTQGETGAMSARAHSSQI